MTTATDGQREHFSRIFFRGLVIFFSSSKTFQQVNIPEISLDLIFAIFCSSTRIFSFVGFHGGKVYGRLFVDGYMCKESNWNLIRMKRSVAFHFPRCLFGRERSLWILYLPKFSRFVLHVLFLTSLYSVFAEVARKCFR